VDSLLLLLNNGAITMLAVPWNDHSLLQTVLNMFLIVYVAHCLRWKRSLTWRTVTSVAARNRLKSCEKLLRFHCFMYDGLLPSSVSTHCLTVVFTQVSR